MCFWQFLPFSIRGNFFFPHLCLCALYWNSIKQKKNKKRFIFATNRMKNSAINVDTCTSCRRKNGFVCIRRHSAHCSDVRGGHMTQVWLWFKYDYSAFKSNIENRFVNFSQTCIRFLAIFLFFLFLVYQFTKWLVSFCKFALIACVTAIDLP